MDETKEYQEIITTITKTKEDRKSQATKINELIRILKDYDAIKKITQKTQIKEPIMFLGRRNGTFEMLEGVTTGLYEFTHSDGEKRFIIIDANRQSNFGIGKNKIRGYWAHEDYPVTGYPDPIITTEQVNIIIDKTLNDIKKWLSKELQARGDMWMKIGLGVGFVILAVAIFKILVPTKAITGIDTTPIIQNITNTTKIIIQNATTITV